MALKRSPVRPRYAPEFKLQSVGLADLRDLRRRQLSHSHLAYALALHAHDPENVAAPFHLVGYLGHSPELMHDKASQRLEMSSFLIRQLIYLDYLFELIHRQATVQ